MPTREQKNATDLGEQAIALAEQLGRIAGTIEGTAEGWMHDPALAKQLMRVRDGAARMLESISGSGARPARRARTSRMSSDDPAHAPGKRHRRPAPTARGVKKSEASIPKLRTAHTVRQRRKSYA